MKPRIPEPSLARLDALFGCLGVFLAMLALLLGMAAVIGGCAAVVFFAIRAGWMLAAQVFS